jgi:uncharacterized protein (DUF2141 family)
MPLFALFSALKRRGAIAALALLTGLGAMPAPVAASDSLPAPANCTGPVSKTWLKVVVEGLHNAHGQIAITLYGDDPSRFLVHHGALYVGRVPATAPNTSSCIYLPHPGVYVVAIYHDANGNGSFDRNSIGLPAEAYGFSNNPPTLLGLPSFSSVRLNAIHSGLTAHIKLTYP